MVLIACATKNHSVLYPMMHMTERYTNIYFGENQLSPGSFGISPLIPGHLNPLQRIRVRASPQFSLGFTLPRTSSPGFGSSTNCLFRPVRACFHYASPSVTWLDYAVLRILTGSFFNRHDVIVLRQLRLLVSR